MSSPADDNLLENVLILQGGGSLGAFGCGVFKALVNNNIKLDIVAAPHEYLRKLILLF
jgi:predicted acylesterase/phospholipase RssA